MGSASQPGHEHSPLALAAARGSYRGRRGCSLTGRGRAWKGSLAFRCKRRVHAQVGTGAGQPPRVQRRRESRGRLPAARRRRELRRGWLEREGRCRRHCSPAGHRAAPGMNLTGGVCRWRGEDRRLAVEWTAAIRLRSPGVCLVAHAPRLPLAVGKSPRRQRRERGRASLGRGERVRIQGLRARVARPDTHSDKEPLHLPSASVARCVDLVRQPFHWAVAACGVKHLLILPIEPMARAGIGALSLPVYRPSYAGHWHAQRRCEFPFSGVFQVFHLFASPYFMRPRAVLRFRLTFRADQERGQSAGVLGSRTGAGGPTKGGAPIARRGRLSAQRSSQRWPRRRCLELPPWQLLTERSPAELPAWQFRMSHGSRNCQAGNSGAGPAHRNCHPGNTGRE